MMVYFKYLLLTVLMLLLCIDMISAAFSAIPERIVIGGNDPSRNLLLSCNVRAHGISEVELGKTLPGGNVPIIQIFHTNDSMVIKDTTLQQRMTHDGGFDPDGGGVTITLHNLQCSDAGTYYCTTTFRSSSSTKSTVSVAVIASPDDVQMFVTPSRYQYEPSTLVEFSCMGTIGNQLLSDLPHLWDWEWRHTEWPNIHWTPYPHTNNITYRTPKDDGDCQYIGATTLRHTVTAADDGREFRCYAIDKYYGGFKTIYVSKHGNDLIG